MILRIDQISDDDLLAYVDGQLDDDARAVVKLYLSDNPEKAELVAQWQQQSEAIKALYGPAVDEEIPDRLRPHAIAAAQKSPRAANDNIWRMAAAAMVLVVFGSGLGWYGRDVLPVRGSASQTLITAALGAHDLFANQSVHAVEVDASDRTHLASWLSASLDRRLVVPNFLPNGFKLVGGRLLPSATSAANSAAAQLMYEAEGNRRVSLYLTPKTDAEPTQNEFAQGDNVVALYWANSALTCTIVGDLTRAEMEEIASKVFQALNWQDETYQRG